ncbi:ectoine/hydroxyectoine ABC transporter substrate-binding protein EhuB [Blastopirellula marina]|uniref:Ectoine/hydroxyectoine ABC transporter substrate-binding protein EhuB n=1 Tax=Blastopirellula marina TaxID=124 RepID=A0A2S8G8M3_9BACT|nr:MULTISPECIES: ectoine/hydroxyectoine ABC transporter substrate-binding protein EhuB [Pirellulaceae]PQO40806.1 ectoine/hydroxyectoine ABC transporter substrate-binding protein EhuB [Blastopirellula marina]RCS56133.1 ectoine/hydroxyectoine ABC transporter substrate-binding protein EhuB [Bremerella cremea]
MFDEKKSEISLTGVLALLILSACLGAIFWQANHANTSADATLARIQKAGTVRIGFANEAPYGYLDTSSGKVTGEAPEIAKAILKRMGVEHVEPIVADFGSLIPGLKAKRFDIIAAGMYITPTRAQEISFSNPSYAIGESFIVKAGNPLELHGYEDVRDNPNAKLGVMGGSVEQGYARDMGVDDRQVLVFSDYNSAILGLKGGQIDAVAATDLTVNDLLQKQASDEIEKATDFHDPVIDGQSIRGYGAFGFRQEDVALRERFDEELAQFIGSPEHLQLVKRFGFDQSTLPGNMTAKELSKAP